MSSTELYLREELGQHWHGRDVFSVLEQIEGEVFRHKEGRKTLRFELSGKSYFLKYHRGIGWPEIFKNWLQLRAPIIGAQNEWQAIHFLEKQGIKTMTLAGYGQQGENPAAKQSFVITDDLTNTMSLERLGEQWHERPPTFSSKQILIRKLALISKTMHEKGMTHRDFYLVHFLLDEDFAQHNTITEDTELFLIDLHRALISEGKAVKERWLVKDIGSLYFSAMDVVLTRRDLYRFMMAYSGKSLRETLATQRDFWIKVRQRALKLRNADNAVVIESLNPLRSFIKGNKQMAVPFDIEMAGQTYHCEKILRLLPKKRLVVEARSEQHHAVIKLFSAKQKGQQEINREYDGYNDAQAAGVPVPQVIFAAQNQTGVLSIAYQYIEQAQTLLLLTAEQRRAYLPALFELVAKCHRYGIYQDDIHLDNFLVANGRLYMVDLGSIRRQTRGEGLSPIKSLKNVAHLVSEFDKDEQASLAPHIEQYYRYRQSVYNEREQGFFAKYCSKAWQRRKRNYLKKQFRNCTMTQYQSGLSRQSAFRSDFLDGDTTQFVDQIEQWMEQGESLKQGNSATVVKVEVAGQPIVIKRYNMKSTGHLLRRCLRPSRAAVSWRNANLLEFLDVPTAKPLGFIENRRFGLRHTAYFICEFNEARGLDEVYKDRDPTEQELAQIKTIFNRLQRDSISHGDMKASNFLLDNQGQISLIDLDAMTDQHCTEKAFNQARLKDRARFMQNWQQKPELLDLFSFDQGPS